MLRQQEPTRIEPNSTGRSTENELPQHPAAFGDDTRTAGVDIQRELNRLEEIVLDSPRIPMTRRTLVDEEQLLDQLDLVRINLPIAFQEAELIIRHKDDLLQEAELYAQEIIEAAEQRAAELLNDMGLIQQAKVEADQLRQQVLLDCEAIQQATVAEVEQIRYQAQEELAEMRARAMAECEEIQNGADDYADQVLDDIEHKLSDALRVVSNGRQQLDNVSGS
ncbi:DivIVA domain-containing protein [Tychonema sp. BBK16]|uniref:DivIVA domain-containing protein n=1 Tax=Tychonema sp. BBK16 TaxID=2699888 RepID=UPI001F422606|nr:DivIVA domain-containing protein [Tychonema sp. BBK16]MCF6373465.1 DivIVA domain-containing protein [Tychonema sp. BBK16]